MDTSKAEFHEETLINPHFRHVATYKKNPDSSEETCNERSNVSEDLLDKTTQDPLLISNATSHHTNTPHHSNTDELPRPPCEFVDTETEFLPDDFIRGKGESMEDKDKVISGLKEDLLMTIEFATALKRKLDELYQCVFDDDVATAVVGLTDTLGIVGTIVKEGVRLEKVTEYRFVKRTEN